MGRYGTRDYPSLAKTGFLLGLGLFALGAGGEVVGRALLESLPAWEHTLFVYCEAIGLVVGFLSPWIFGVVLPLTE